MPALRGCREHADRLPQTVRPTRPTNHRVQGVSMIIELAIAASIGLTPVQPVTEPDIGYEVSAYQGKWYSAKWEPVRKCIMQRESRHNYRAKNRSSSASGAYQFLDSQWRDSLVWILRRDTAKPHRYKLEKLREIPINKWPRYYQDQAFWTVWRKGAGRHHWAPTHPNTPNCY